MSGSNMIPIGGTSRMGSSGGGSLLKPNYLGASSGPPPPINPHMPAINYDRPNMPNGIPLAIQQITNQHQNNMHNAQQERERQKRKDGGETREGRSREKDEEGGRKRKKRSRWTDEAQKTFIPGLPTMIPAGLSKDQEAAYLLQLKIEEASRRLRSGDLGIPLNPEDR